MILRIRHRLEGRALLLLLKYVWAHSRVNTIHVSSRLFTYYFTTYGRYSRIPLGRPSGTAALLILAKAPQFSDFPESKLRFCHHNLTLEISGKTRKPTNYFFSGELTLEAYSSQIFWEGKSRWFLRSFPVFLDALETIG